MRKTHPSQASFVTDTITDIKTWRVPNNMAYTPWILLVILFDLDPTRLGNLIWTKEDLVFDLKARSPTSMDYSSQISNTCLFHNVVLGQPV